MSAEVYTARFLIYPKDIEKFLEYCKRFDVIQETKISYVVEKEFVEEDSFIWKDSFICDVILHSQMEYLRFINVFGLFFRESKYCSRI